MTKDIDIVKPFEHYPGGKNGSGTYQTIINCIRPHIVYIELCLGNGAVMSRKKKAIINIGNDIDSEVMEQWKTLNLDWLYLLKVDAIEFLKGIENFRFFQEKRKTVIYIDPPYPKNSRKSQRDIYKFEPGQEWHIELLKEVNRLKDIPWLDIIISTYPNDLYKQELSNWGLITFESTTRAGMALEWLFTNYDNHEGVLHDYRYIGEDYRERERINKKVNREVKKLLRLPAPERNAILSAIEEKVIKQSSL